MDPTTLMLVTLDLGERQRFHGMANTEQQTTAAHHLTMIIRTLAQGIVAGVRSSVPRFSTRPSTTTDERKKVEARIKNKI